ncbi:MAG: hypothetical protein WBP59_01295, partial [Ilumatobacteraceae bacterium]
MGGSGDVDLGRSGRIPNGELSRPFGRPLPDEIRRDRLLDHLADRWNRRLVLIAAPGGYGKTTVLAQAIRDNDDDPSGIDVFVRCQAWFENVGDLVVAMLAAMPKRARPVSAPRPTVDDVLAAMARLSPVDVCLHLDDVQHLSGLDDAPVMLEQLVRGLPFNAHLVLAGRSLPELRLARLRSGDEVLEIGPADLSFDGSELAMFAAGHGVVAETLAAGGQWPAVTRLAVTMGPSEARGYLLEEVVHDLAPSLRGAVAVALIAGTADDDLLRSCGVDTSVAEVLRTVPLIVDFGDGSVGAHDLWAEVAEQLVDASTVAALTGSIARHALATDDPFAAIDFALRSEQWQLAWTAMIAVIADGDLRLTSVEAASWLAALPDAERGRAEGWLLQGVLDRLIGRLEGGIDDLLAAGQEFRAREDVVAERAVVRELGTRSWLLARPE